MPTSRIQRLIAVGLIVTVVPLLALTVQVSLPAAANGTNGVNSSRALRGTVTISLKGKRLGPSTNAGRGWFTLSGAIADRGTFVDSPGLIVIRALNGTKGAIWISVGAPTRGSRCQCNWEIIEGTKAYAGLHGRGNEGGRYSSTINITMNGTVSQ